ncbi:MAG: DNA repair protein RecO [Rhodothermales bacterium]
MIIRTEAIVLRTMEYGETSQIVTLFTREKGKMTVLAKGARLMKSRFGSSLQPMSYTQVVFYYKPTRGLQTLTESAHVHPFHHISRNLEKLSVGLRMMDLVYALIHAEEHNPQVFSLLLQVLSRLDTAETHTTNLLPYFQMRLATVLGFAPDIDREAVQTLPDEGGVLTLDAGAVLPADASPRAARRASRTALRAYAILARSDLDTVMRLRLEPPVRREVNGLIEDYLRYHFEDAYPSRSDKIIGQLLSNDPSSSPFTPRNA